MTVLSVNRDDDSLTVELSGSLDGDLGEQLLELTKVALTVTPQVVIELAAVTEWTHEGLDALLECAGLGARVPSTVDLPHPNR